MRIILLSAFALFLLLPENIQAQVTVKPGIYLLPDIKMKMDSIPGKGICALWKGTSIFPYHRK